MYKEKELIRIVDVTTGEVKYGKADHSPIRNWGDYTLVNNDEVEFENGVFSSLKDDEFIHYKGMTIGTGKRLVGMFEHPTEEEILGEFDEDYLDYLDSTKGLVTDPLEDWLS